MIRGQWAMGRWVSRKALSHQIVFFTSLGHFLKAHLPLMEALQFLLPSLERSLRAPIRKCLQRLQEGYCLSESLSPLVFDATTLTLIHMGEKTGHVAEAVIHVQAYLRRKRDLRDHLTQSLRYPLFVLIVLMVCLTFLFQTLVPNLVHFWGALGGSEDAPLPWATRSLIAVAEVFEKHGLSLVWGALGSGVLTFYTWHRHPSSGVRLGMEWLLLQCPGKGLALTALWGKFFTVFHTLLKGGIPLLESLEHAAQTLPLVCLRQRIAQGRVAIRGGGQLATVFQGMPGLSSLVLPLIRTGEKNAQLVDLTGHIVQMYAADYAYRKERLLTLLPGVLLGVLGGLLLWILSGTLIPLYTQMTMTPGQAFP